MGELKNKADKFISPVQGHYSDLEIDKAKGIYLYSTDGRKIMDFTSGIAVANTGHCHPEVVKAIFDQSQKLMHICAGVAYYPAYVDLAEKLVKITPFSDAKVYFSQSGSEAIECSLKLAKYVSKKKTLVAFTHSFHGRTLGALSATYKKKYRNGYEDWLISDTKWVKYPYCYRCPFGEKYGSCTFKCISQMKELIYKHINDIAAVIIEPILGEGGYVPAPVEFIQELRTFTADNNIILIFDEIQSGFGRTGTMFAMNHYDVVPDIVALAKGIASGMPLGACVAKTEIMNQWTTSSHGGTYPGNPVTCAASMATINVLQKEKLLENAYEMGQYMKATLKDLMIKYPVIGDVRGFGLMIGVEFIKPETGDYNTELVTKLRVKALEKGLVLISCGDHDQVIRMIPPLMITKEEVKKGLDIFVDALRDALNG